ncbi:MAG: HAD family hydrolase [Pseudomonadota bacterium]
MLVLGLAGAALADPLPSWNAGETKSRITAFVGAVTDPASADFVPRAERVAVFDNDGTLWAEKPLYFQALFAFDLLKQRAAADPSILTSDTLKAAAAGDLETVLAGGVEALLEVVNASHAGLSVADFQAASRDWLETALHPETGRPFVAHVYQPMLELLRFLRDEGFATFIVSGGGIHFIRAYAEDAYGIPPRQVIGTVAESAYERVDGVPIIVKKPGIAFLDDKAGKPVGIDRVIGRRPILAFGNSDGDFEMLEWVTGGQGARLGLLLHHTDDAREWAYDRESHVGKLVRGLDEAETRGWRLVDMARDWKTVFPERE